MRFIQTKQQLSKKNFLIFSKSIFKTATKQVN